MVFVVSPQALAGRLVMGALREHDAATQARELARRALHVNNVGRTLTAAIDETETRDAVRRVSLLRRGSWSILELVESDGSLHRFPALHPDPAKRALTEALDHTWSALPLASETGVQVLTPQSGAALVAALHDAGSVSALAAIGFGAIVIVPLLIERTRGGTLLFVTAEGETRVAAEEVDMAREIATFCVLALQKARLYGEAMTLRQAADGANRAKSAFLATMSHELRTPLNAIGGFVELIDLELYGSITPDQRAAVARIRANQRHLLQLITDVLDFARVDAGHAEYALDDVPLGAVVGEVAEMIATVAAAKHMTLVVPDGEEVHARADAQRVRQIVVNLVANAIKYSTDGAGAITITWAAEGDTALLRVADHGPGIPLEQRERIFKPFVQLASSLSDRRGGVGLGLAISRELAVAMGGELAVANNEDGGSIFTLTLPLIVSEKNQTH